MKILNKLKTSSKTYMSQYDIKINSIEGKVYYISNTGKLFFIFSAIFGSILTWSAYEFQF